MFITVTIDTSQKRKLRLHKKRFNSSTGWRKTINTKKRSLHHRIAAWKRSFKTKNYKLDGQVAMF